MKKRGIVITQTPFRISFFGGGTDTPDYFNEFGGAVLGVTTDKYMYVTMNSLERLMEKRIRISYSKLELVDKLSEINHDIVREVMMQNLNFTNEGFFDIHSYADLPAGTGVGSSSSFCVGLINAISNLQGISLSPKQLAQEAITIEREILHEHGGWQDQIFAAYGGFLKISFADNLFSVDHVDISKESLQVLTDSMLLLFTYQSRSSSSVQGIVLSKENIRLKLRAFQEMKEMVNQGMSILSSLEGDELIKEFGLLLHESWLLKRSLSKSISDNNIDGLYDVARSNGAFGGKLCGAGGGGFLLLLAPPEKHESILSNCKGVTNVASGFHLGGGSRVVFNQ